MGCDIHCYIEFRWPGSGHWQPFGGRINPGRNYVMFGFLAGVRGDGPPVVEPRGVPDDMAIEANLDNWLIVTDDAETAGTDPNFVSRLTAEQYMQHGAASKVVGDSLWVGHPDWHNHSWLDTAEWSEAIDRFGAWDSEHGWPIRDSILEYEAMLKAMQHFDVKGYEARVVFWFDN